MRSYVVLLIFACFVKSTHHEASVSVNGNGNNSSGEAEFSKRGYGEPCTCDSDCDFGKWLMCQNGYCNCAKNAFIYDYGRQTCVVRLGEKCFEIAQEYSEYNPKDLPPSIRCVEGAFCSMSAGGVCACNTYGFYQALDLQSCQRKKTYGQPCTKGHECKSDVCSRPGDGKCICNIGEFYHKRRRRCVSLVGALCFGDDDCLDNGICLEHTAVCGCAQGFLETSIKTCEMRLNYGDSCSEANPCNNPELACIESECVCRYSNHQTFDNSSEIGHCLSEPGGPCVHDENCGKNSKCVNVGIWNECVCYEGFLEMPNGQCEKFSKQGDVCQRNSDCDPIPPLVCRDGQCDCGDELTKYDISTRSCRSLVGGKCDPSDNYSCVANAMCSQINKVKSRCRCQQDFSVTRDRNCVPS